MTDPKLELFKLLFEDFFPTLDYNFIAMMNRIGEYGSEKYGENSFEAKRKRGALERDMERVQSAEIIKHGQLHGEAYLAGELHDHFGTLEDQLAAMSFNSYMEYVFRQADQWTSKNTSNQNHP